jgi:hypothetical protein
MLDKASNVPASYSEVMRDAGDAMRSTSVQLTILNSKLSDAIGTQLLPEITKLIPQISALVPEVAKVVKGMVELGGWLAKNPLEGLGAALTLSIAYEIAKAKLGDVLAAGLARVFAGAPVAGVPLVGGAGGVVGTGGRLATYGGRALGGVMGGAIGYSVGATAGQLVGGSNSWQETGGRVAGAAGVGAGVGGPVGALVGAAAGMLVDSVASLVGASRGFDWGDFKYGNLFGDPVRDPVSGRALTNGPNPAVLQRQIAEDTAARKAAAEAFNATLAEGARGVTDEIKKGVASAFADARPNRTDRPSPVK